VKRTMPAGRPNESPSSSRKELCGDVTPGPVSPVTCETDRWTAWDRFLESVHQAGFMQSSWWADFRATAGFGHFGITLKDQGAIVGGALALRFSYAPQRCFYYIQDGPVLPDSESARSEVFEAILEAIEERRQSETETVSHLRIEPRWPHLPAFVRGFQRPACSDKYREPRNTLCVELRHSEETILAQMKPKGRYNIRVAQRHGVSVFEDTSKQGVTDFLRIYKRTALRQGLKAKPPGYFRTLVSLLMPLKRVSIVFAEYGGRRLATAMVVFFGRRATYFFGGSLARDRHVMAPYLLHFEAIRRAKAMGCEWYDFWGVAPRNEPHHPWHRIGEFKRKFGGVEVNLVPTLDYVYDSAAYAQYVACQTSR
jgi:peptidoglycan pentaglycine glycine transferase (the first glycine)